MVTHLTDHAAAAGAAGAAAGAVLLGPARLLDLLRAEGGELGQRHRDGLLPAVQLVVEVHHVAPQPAVVPETGAGGRKGLLYLAHRQT